MSLWPPNAPNYPSGADDFGAACASKGQLCDAQVLDGAGTILFWRMLSMDEELKAAVAAKAAVDTQSTAPLSSATIAILREAIRAATPATMFLSEGHLTEARYETAIALSDLIAGPPTQPRIDQAKSAVEHWLKELREASLS